MSEAITSKEDIARIHGEEALEAFEEGVWSSIAVELEHTSFDHLMKLWVDEYVENVWANKSLLPRAVDSLKGQFKLTMSEPDADQTAHEKVDLVADALIKKYGTAHPEMFYGYKGFSRDDVFDVLADDESLDLSKFSFSDDSVTYSPDDMTSMIEEMIDNDEV